MARTEPKMWVRKILSENWDPAATSLGTAPAIHTGKYTHGQGDVPVIAITSADEGPLSRGETEYFGLDGDGGGGVQLIAGAVTVDVVAGTYEDTNINPKKLRWEMYDHMCDLLVQYQHTTDLRSLAPGRGHDIVEMHDATNDGDGQAESAAVFKKQVRVAYTYLRG